MVLLTYAVDAEKMPFVEAPAGLALEGPQNLEEDSNIRSLEVARTTVVRNVFVLHLPTEGTEEGSLRDKKYPAVAVAVAAAAAVVVVIEGHAAGSEYIVVYRDRRRVAGSQGHDNNVQQLKEVSLHRPDDANVVAIADTQLRPEKALSETVADYGQVFEGLAADDGEGMLAKTAAYSPC